MKKQAVYLLAIVFLGSLACGQTFKEEMRQEKLLFRQFQTGQHQVPDAVQEQATSFEEEMRLVKLEHHAFRVAQRRAHSVVTEAEEMRQVKRDYRAFLSEQSRQRRVTAEKTP